MTTGALFKMMMRVANIIMVTPTSATKNWEPIKRQRSRLYQGMKPHKKEIGDRVNL
jgi:hypothetical protein